MAFEFDTYLLDEVTAFGDGRFLERCQRWFEEKVYRATLIYASHNLGEVRRICSSVLVLLKDAAPRFFMNVDAGIRFYLDYLAAVDREQQNNALNA